MTETEFIAKYKNNVERHWGENASSLFWARSYNMPLDELIEMSKNFLRTSPPKSSSYSLACRTLREHDERFKNYGIASLFF